MATNPPVTIGELSNVPAPGSGIQSAWAQSVTRRIVHRFANVAARDAQYPAAGAGVGAECVTVDTGAFWVVAPIGATPTWVRLPGTEAFHTEIAAAVTVSATSAASAVSVINPGSVTYDGSPVIIEFYSPGISTPAVAGGQIIVNLWDTSTDLGWLVSAVTPAAAALTVPAFARRRLTPTAGAHTYTIRAWVFPSGSGTIQAGAGASWSPSYMRVTKA